MVGPPKYDAIQSSLPPNHVFSPTNQWHRTPPCLRPINDVQTQCPTPPPSATPCCLHHYYCCVATKREKGGRSSPPAAALSLQVSALADLEGRIAALGGLLNSYSSEGTRTPPRSSSLAPPTRSPPDSPRSPPSFRQPSLSPPVPAPPTPPAANISRFPRSQGVAAVTSGSGSFDRYRWSDAKRVDEGSSPARGGGDAASALSSRDGDKDDGSSSGTGWIGGCYASSVSSTAAAPVLGGGGDGRGDSIASDLAREVEELLRASGGSSNRSVGGADAGSNSNSLLFKGGRPIESMAGGATRGWAELEGMAERLEALVGRGGSEDEAGSVGMTSGYSSSRGLASVSSPGGGGRGGFGAKGFGGLGRGSEGLLLSPSESPLHR